MIKTYLTYLDENPELGKAYPDFKWEEIGRGEIPKGTKVQVVQFESADEGWKPVFVVGGYLYKINRSRLEIHTPPYGYIVFKWHSLAKPNFVLFTYKPDDQVSLESLTRRVEILERKIGEKDDGTQEL